MDFIALLDMRPMHWYVYVPALACGSPLANRDDAEAAAAALVTTSTGLTPADFHITLHVAHGAAMVVQDPHTEVDVRHRDGAWYTAEHLGWLRTWDGGWQALVSYSAEGASWERAMPHRVSAAPTSEFRREPDRRRASSTPRRIARVGAGPGAVLDH